MPRSFIKPYVVLLIVLGLCACLSCSTITVKSPAKANAKPVTEQQARRIVRDFLAPRNPKDLAFVGVTTRSEFPPRVPCYSYKFTAEVVPRANDPSIVTKNPKYREELKDYQGARMNVSVLVAKATGRVLQLRPDVMYTSLKHLHEKQFSKADVIPASRASQIVTVLLEKAGVLKEEGRLKIELTEPVLNTEPDSWSGQDTNRFCYDFYWQRHERIKGIGDVAMPEEAFGEVDAVTGEVDYFLYKDYPVLIKVSKPLIAAIAKSPYSKHAVDGCKEIELTVDQSNLHKLVWRVELKNHDEDNCDVIFVDAQSGKVMGAIVIDRGM
jgi:hypothetical protein